MSLKAEEIRKWNTRTLADRAGGITRFAEKSGRSQAQVSHIIGKTQVKNIDRRLARMIEKENGKADGWLDVPHVTEWLQVAYAPWAIELRGVLQAAGITVEDATPKTGPEIELMTLFSILAPLDRRRLVSIARVMASPFASTDDATTPDAG